MLCQVHILLVVYIVVYWLTHIAGAAAGWHIYSHLYTDGGIFFDPEKTFEDFRGPEADP